MPVPKTDALPLGYTPYGLVWTVERGEVVYLLDRRERERREKQGSKNEPCKNAGI